MLFAEIADPLQSTGLSAVVWTSGGYVQLASAPGQVTKRVITNGTVVTTTGSPESGWIPVKGSFGTGWLPDGCLSAVTETYMPSAQTPKLNVPAQSPSQQGIQISQGPDGTISIKVVQLPQILAGRPEGINVLGVNSGGWPVGPGAPAPPLFPPQIPGKGAQGSNLNGSTNIIATSQGSGNGPRGNRLDASRPFASLPHSKVLNQTLTAQVCDGQGKAYGRSLSMPVQDVGPWRTNDDYWAKGKRPVAEGLKGVRVRWNKKLQGWEPGSPAKLTCNGAGIDLSIAAWRSLLPNLSQRQAENQTGRVNWRLGSGSGRAD